MNPLLKRLRKLADEELEVISAAIHREIQLRAGEAQHSSDQDADATVLSYGRNEKPFASWGGDSKMRKRRKFRRAA